MCALPGAASGGVSVLPGIANTPLCSGGLTQAQTRITATSSCYRDSAGSWPIWSTTSLRVCQQLQFVTTPGHCLLIGVSHMFSDSCCYHRLLELTCQCVTRIKSIFSHLGGDAYHTPTYLLVSVSAAAVCLRPSFPIYN